MNKNNLFTRLKCLIVLVLAALLDIGPFPITALTGVLIIVFLPRWFKELVDRLYGGRVKNSETLDSARNGCFVISGANLAGLETSIIVRIRRCLSKRH